jgi:hypothetical protein
MTDGWTVANVRRETCVPCVFGAGRPAILADLTHETGATMSVSRYDDEPGWGVDAAFSANGVPQWSNGDGARYLRVRMLDDDTDVVRALDAARDELVASPAS